MHGQNPYYSTSLVAEPDQGAHFCELNDDKLFSPKSKNSAIFSYRDSMQNDKE